MNLLTKMFIKSVTLVRHGSDRFVAGPPWLQFEFDIVVPHISGGSFAVFSSIGNPSNRSLVASIVGGYLEVLF